MQPAALTMPIDEQWPHDVNCVSMRERLAQHRADPACAGCHKLMDPAGLRWRITIRRQRDGFLDSDAIA
jgi:hypothetical protein